MSKYLILSRQNHLFLAWQEYEPANSWSAFQYSWLRIEAFCKIGISRFFVWPGCRIFGA